MSEIPRATVQVEWAKGGLSRVLEPGGFIGGGLEWDEVGLEFRGWVRQRDEDGKAGIVWEPGLKAAICAWAAEARDVTGAGFGAEAFGWDTRDQYSALTGQLVAGTTRRGQWKLAAADGNLNKLAWQVYATEANGKYYLRSNSELPADRAFVLWIYAEPGRPGGATRGEFVGVRFGTQWELRWPAYGQAELRKRSAGTWSTVLVCDWRLPEVTEESHAKRGFFVGVLPIDGKLLIKAQGATESTVYRERRAITVPAGPVAFLGLGRTALFGLHEVAFEDRLDNWLLSENEVQLGWRPSQAPEAVVIGHVPAGATAEVQHVVAGVGRPPGTYTRYTLGLRMAPTTDGRQTPAIRMVGLDYPAVAEEPERTWEDVSGDFQSFDGRREYRFEQRLVGSRCTVQLDNMDGRYRNLSGARVMRVGVSRGGEVWPRFSGLAFLSSVEAQSIADTTAAVEIVDPTDLLEDIPVGVRRPLDGMLVSEAIQEVLSWAYLPASLIGDIYASGARLPSTAYGAAWWGGSPQTGALDETPAAAVQFEPNVSVAEALRYLMGFDYGTALFWNPELGQMTYVKLELGSVVRTYTEVEAGELGEKAIRRSVSRRPMVREVVTGIVVRGRDRWRKTVLAAEAWDREALQNQDSIRFRAMPKGLEERDESLGEQRFVNLRCRYLFEWYRRMREERAFECLGQELAPPAKITVVEAQTGQTRDYWVLAIADQADSQGKWDSQIDAAVWAA